MLIPLLKKLFPSIIFSTEKNFESKKCFDRDTVAEILEYKNPKVKPRQYIDVIEDSIETYFLFSSYRLLYDTLPFSSYKSYNLFFTEKYDFQNADDTDIIFKMLPEDEAEKFIHWLKKYASITYDKYNKIKWSELCKKNYLLIKMFNYNDWSESRKVMKSEENAYLKRIINVFMEESGEPEESDDGEDQTDYLCANDDFGHRFAAVGDSIIINKLQKFSIRYPHIADLVHDYFYPEVIRSMITGSPLKFTNMLLTGEPGIGKTWFSKKIADILGLHFDYFSFANTDANFSLVGLDRSFLRAQPGLITDNILIKGELKKLRPVANALFFIDEVDKYQSTRDFDPIRILYDLLESENSKTWKSQFLPEIPIDLSKINWIMAANDTSAIPSPILSRCDVIDFPDPQSNTEFYRVVLKSILEDYQHDYSGVQQSGKVIELYFNQDVVDSLLEVPLREVYRLIKRGVNNALENIYRNDSEIKQLVQLTVSGEDIKNILKAKKDAKKMSSKKNLYGSGMVGFSYDR